MILFETDLPTTIIEDLGNSGQDLTEVIKLLEELLEVGSHLYIMMYYIVIVASAFLVCWLLYRFLKICMYSY